MHDGAIFWLVNLCAYLRHPGAIRTFRRVVGYFPNVACPSRYNEKMLWRKIFDHNPLFVTFSDKLAAKLYVSDHCPDLRIARVLWVGDDAAMLPPDLLHRPIVIKASHGWAQNYFPGKVDGFPDLPADRINGWLAETHGADLLEWSYGLVEPKLFAEELIAADCDDELIDLSVHAFDGTPRIIEAIVGNNGGNRRKGYFRIDGTRWPELERKPGGARPRRTPLEQNFRLPASYGEALSHTERLAAGVDYARFDFIAAADRLYAGEITVYPGSGMTRHADFLMYNSVVSDHWDLAKSWFLRSRHRGIRQAYAEALARFLRSKDRQA